MLTVRRLTIDDYEAAIALWQRSGLPSIRPHGRDSKVEFAQQIDRGQFVIGLEDDGKLIGIVVATNDTRKGWINRLAIDPGYRRKGHGTQLIHAAEDALRAIGIKVIAALIEDWNDASLALFKREGYAVHSDIVYVSKRDSESD
jgi:ribosomal protein S18 acetylase RimI-like enzyme